MDDQPLSQLLDEPMKGPRRLPSPEQEALMVAHATGLDLGAAAGIVAFGIRTRRLQGDAFETGASTQMLVQAARLMRGGATAAHACRVVIVEVLSTDPGLRRTLEATLDASF